MNYILRREGWGDNMCRWIADHMQQDVRVVLNDPMPATLSGYVFRWATTSSIINRERNRVTVVNTAAAIHSGYNKRLARLTMQERGILVPTTFDLRDTRIPIPSTASPWLARPEHHQAGVDSIVVRGMNQLIAARERLGQGYISKLIKKEHEYRVYVVSGRAIAVSEKMPEDKAAITWGGTNASEENINWGAWPLRVVAEAIAASNLFHYDFCAVDVVVDADGSPYVLECNSGPQSSEYRAQKFAQAFDYIIQHGKANIPVANTGDWRSVIHPAVSREAA
jgi:glutathione synthase/RimK-type ligase-like ATP-grasp enzyme